MNLPDASQNQYQKQKVLVVVVVVLKTITKTEHQVDPDVETDLRGNEVDREILFLHDHALSPVLAALAVFLALPALSHDTKDNDVLMFVDARIPPCIKETDLSINKVISRHTTGFIPRKFYYLQPVTPLLWLHRVGREARPRAEIQYISRLSGSCVRSNSRSLNFQRKSIWLWSVNGPAKARRRKTKIFIYPVPGPVDVESESSSTLQRTEREEMQKKKQKAYKERRPT